MKLMLVLSFLLIGFSAVAGESLVPLNLQHCSAEFCFELNSVKGYRSPLDLTVISFDKANIKVYDKGGQKLIQQAAGEGGFFDQELGYLLLRDIKDGKSLMLNTRTGTITKL